MKVPHVTLNRNRYTGSFLNHKLIHIEHYAFRALTLKKMGHLEMENVQHKLGPKRVGRKWYRRLWELFSAAKDRAKPLSDQVSLGDQSCAQQTVFIGMALASTLRLLTCGSPVHRFYIRAKPLCEWVHQQIIFTHLGQFVKVCTPTGFIQQQLSREVEGYHVLSRFTF